MEFTPDRLKAYRARMGKMVPGGRVASQEEAVSFVNERGFIFFWPCKGSSLPSLWSAVAGDRPVPDEHDDPGHVTWDWKDKLLGQRKVYYARLLKRRNTFVSLPLLPYFYALSPNYGDIENDYIDQYEMGQMTMEAKNVYEAILKEGPLDTLSLRKSARLAAENNSTRFTKAIDDLQVEMKVMPIGIAEVGAWKYAFIYDIVARHYEELDQLARPIDESDARKKLVMVLLQTTGAVPKKEVQSLFRWRPEDSRKVIAALVQEGCLVDECQMQGEKGEWIALAEFAHS